MDEPFITAEEAGELVGCSPEAMAGMRFRGNGPKFYKPTPRKVFYRRSEVLAWIERGAKQRTDDVATAK